MKGPFNWKSVIGMFLIISLPQWVLAKEGKPLPVITLNQSVIKCIADTIPPSPPPKAPESIKNDEKPVVNVIKVVPKARRQAIPVPVNVKVKSVKIIKPALVRPLIKILH